MFIIRLDLDEILATTQKHQLFNTNIVVPDHGENWWRHNWRKYEKTDTSFSAPFATRREISPKYFPYITQVVKVRFGSSAMPRPDLPVSTWKFNLAFASHIPTNGKRALPFFRQVTVVMDGIFSGSLDRSYLSNQKKGLAFHLWVGAWSTPCKKIASKLRSFERGVNNQPIWEHLGWPSS